MVGRVPTEWVAQEMGRRGVTLVVGIIEEHERIVPKPFWETVGITYFEISAVDTTAPDPEDIAEAVKHIAKALRSGESVLVHCMFGHGRSAAVAAAAIAFMENSDRMEEETEEEVQEEMTVRGAAEWMKNNHRSCICPNDAQLTAAEQALEKLSGCDLS